MDKNGEAIYKTHASPFEQPAWGRYTQKPGKLYAHLFDRSQGGQLVIPEIKKPMTRVYLLADENQTPLSTQLTDEGFVISLPEKGFDEIVTVVVLEFLGNLGDK